MSGYALPGDDVNYCGIMFTISVGMCVMFQWDYVLCFSGMCFMFQWDLISYFSGSMFHVSVGLGFKFQ